VAFFEAGVNLLNKRHDDTEAMEEIVFKDVYPMFGLSDVRNSSTERNTIPKGLSTELKLAKELLRRSMCKKLPVVEEVMFKTKNSCKINRGLASGDERRRH
jgi:hypothetical protein